jgi:AmiR/NasT family two-component response regulator
VPSDEVEEKLEAAQAEVAQLHQALANRGPIEQAKGMLMLLLQDCDDDKAFQLLVGASQRRHQKLYEVASSLCEELIGGGALPPEYRDAFKAITEAE